MKISFRWFGTEDDSVTLDQIRQIPGCSGIMGTLPQYTAGEPWEEDAVRSLVKQVQDAGLKMEVIESVNVHESIKIGLPERDHYIETYIQTIRLLARYGIRVIVYNFMPVFDWLRTDLKHCLPDGSTVLYYDHEVLKGLTPRQIVANTAARSNGFSLPGWEPDRLAELDQILEQYESVGSEQLLANLGYFLRAVIPVCEEVGIRMALHPDDPAWPVFGIPRIAHTQAQLDAIMQLYDSPANGLCFCTGSFGSRAENNVIQALSSFLAQGRVVCAHVRNVRILGNKKFQEAAHLSACGNIDLYEVMRVLYDADFDGWIRPDHGRMIWGEQARPGYGLYDRAMGVTYLNGLWEAITKANIAENLEIV